MKRSGTPTPSPTARRHAKNLIKKGLLKKVKDSHHSLELTDSSKTGAPVSSSSDRKKSTIGIIGYGIVGQAVAYGFSRHPILFYDKYKESAPLNKVVDQSDCIFVCLPTPIKSDESGIDLSIVQENISLVASQTAGTDKIIVIKSTVIPGTTKSFIQKYPRSLFCFNPEFLTEASFLQDFVNTDRVVIGAENDLVRRRVASLYQGLIPNTPIFHTDPTTAEMVKYMANCLLAARVIFVNEMYDICQKLGVSYEEVRQMVAADKRIGSTHLAVTSVRGFGGKCFPKDLLALRALAKTLGVDTSMLDTVWKKNLAIRKTRDWEEIPFAVSQNGFGHRC